MEETERILEAMVEAYCDLREKLAQAETMRNEDEDIKRLRAEIAAIEAKNLEKVVRLREKCRSNYMGILGAIPQDGTVRAGPFMVETGPLDDGTTGPFMVETGPLDDGTRGLWITDTRSMKVVD